MNFFELINLKPNKKAKPSKISMASYGGTVPLLDRHIRNCRLVENRSKMLDLLPKGTVCGEVGVLYGNFTREIFFRTQPKKLHLMDINGSFLRMAKDQLPPDQVRDRVFTHEGNSWEMIAQFPDEYFDWLYIDADHTYDCVKKDIEAVRLKVKKDGYIVLNDYTFYDHLQSYPMGVIQAVNEFCIAHDYEVLFFALQDQMFCDVVLKKIHPPH